MFEALVEFLKRNAPGFPIPQAKRFFSSVSTTETSRLFEFLLSQLLPDFKINKLEVDVPEALTILNYPYIRSVTKSALVSITTRQAIVNLLVIFDWLIDFIENADDENMLQSSPVKVFDNILNNPDAIDEEMRLAARNKVTNSESALNELSQINQEYDQMMKRTQEIEQFVTKLKAIADDIEANAVYSEKIKNYCDFRKKELKETKETCLRLEGELENMKRKAESIPLSLAELETLPQALRSNIVHLNETIKLRQAQNSEINNGKTKLSKILADTQKIEKELLLGKKGFETEEARLRQLRDAELSKNTHFEMLRSEVDDLGLRNLRESIDNNRREAISLVEKAEEERDRWNELALIYKDNNKIAKKVSKRLIV